MKYASVVLMFACLATAGCSGKSTDVLDAGTPIVDAGNVEDAGVDAGHVEDAGVDAGNVEDAGPGSERVYTAVFLAKRDESSRVIARLAAAASQSRRLSYDFESSL